MGSADAGFIGTEENEIRMIRIITILFLLLTSPCLAQVDVASLPELSIDATSPVVRVPAGQWRVSSPIILNGRSCIGDGPYISELWPDGDFAVFELTSGPGKTGTQSGAYDGRTTLGVMVSGVSIHGSGVSAGVRVRGRTSDYVRIIDVEVTDCHIGFSCEQATRESWFTRCRAMRCGTGFQVIDTNEVKNDCSNNITFDGCTAMYTRGPGLLVRCVKGLPNPPTRVIRWNGLLHAMVYRNGEQVERFPLVVFDGPIPFSTIEGHFVGSGGDCDFLLSNGVKRLKIEGTYVRHGTKSMVKADAKSSFDVDVRE